MAKNSIGGDAFHIRHVSNLNVMILDIIDLANPQKTHLDHRFSITPGPRLFLSPTKAGMAPLQKRKVYGCRVMLIGSVDWVMLIDWCVCVGSAVGQKGRHGTAPEEKGIYGRKGGIDG